MSVQVPRPALEQKLQGLNSTQQSIEGTSKWLLFYSGDSAAIVRVWYEELKRADPTRKLALLHLANHVLQEGRKKTKAWNDEFAKVIVKAVRHFATTADEKARRGAERVVKVWEERRVFSAKDSKALKDALKAVGGGSTSDDADRKPATHSLAEVKHASESDAPGLPRSSSLASDERKLAAAGELAPLLLEVAKAEQHCSYVVSRGNNVKAVRKITVHGSCV
mmetsp:Transcript_44836/g.133894  ORF Transcript_44836/g.133894 Transcript_44836/m.133894 type:complete len:222 (-) Transcript_44836:1319-1984(-)